ncbi:hypothetical protein CB1_000114024 [Camelus ferus]|nr:hypothetical protein CB1_000114024 [Camelus ferus]
MEEMVSVTVGSRTTAPPPKATEAPEDGLQLQKVSSEDESLAPQGSSKDTSAAPGPGSDKNTPLAAPTSPPDPELLQGSTHPRGYFFHRTDDAPDLDGQSPKHVALVALLDTRLHWGLCPDSP